MTPVSKSAFTVRRGALSLLLLIPLLLLAVGCPRPYPGKPISVKSRPYAVNGFLVAATNGAAEESQKIVDLSGYVFVPGVEVWLRNETSGTESPKVRTDLSGRFTFPPQKPGGYRLCWQGEGFVNGCVGPAVSVVDRHIYLGPLKIGIPRASQGQTVFGRVRFQDGSLPRAFEPLANVNAFARVHALGPALQPAYVNNFGDYILPRVPPGLVTFEARIESAKGAAGPFPPSGLYRRVDLVIGNRPPRLSGILGAAPGARRWTAGPGEQLEMTALAQDEDGDSLRYQWILPDGLSPVSALDVRTARFQVPASNGLYQATVVVYDGKGGYARESLQISTLGIRFAGKVAGTDAPFVSGAEVEVNGKTTTTGAEGRFELTVEEKPPYVLNIRKQGYALVSKVYDRPLTGGHWTLTRATVSTENPKLDIDVVDVRKPSDCPGALSDRIPRRDGYQPPKRDCGPGIQIHIPANALVDEDGNPPAGLVQVSRSTIDVEAPDGMPGDLTAADSGGNVRVMETYGAGFVEVTGGGKKYNLKKGQQFNAKVTIPVPPSVLASGVPLPATVPLLFYDEATGVWKEEGTGKRVGNSYEAFVPHFSTFNMDLLKTNQACLRLEASVMPPLFDLEVKVLPGGGNGGATKTIQITNETQRFHALYNLPTSQTIELRAFQPNTATPIDFLVPGALPATVESAPFLSIDSIAAQIPTDPNRPDFPYAACQKSVELSPFRLPPSTVDTFLAGLYNFQSANLTELDASAPGSSAPWIDASNDYYDTVDPQKLRETLDEFKAVNNFPADEVTAVYANSADLGFGRDMHCRRQAVGGLSGFDVACYVTNYGDRFTNDDQDFVDAVNNTLPIATVGMEYSRIEDPLGPGFVSNTRVVKFYVFKAAQPPGFGRAPSANLDGFGERPVPQLCMTCHGGRYPSGPSLGVPTWDPANPTTANLGSSFIPFDLTGLYTPVYNGTDYKVTQQDEFKKLNTEMVYAAGNTAAIREVVEAMYDGAGFPLDDQVEGFAVLGWDDASGSPSPQDIYTEVVGPSCRTCHISQGPSDIAWNQRSQWLYDDGTGNSFVAFLACSSHQMPHAIATHNRFWLSLNPIQPIAMHDFLNGADPLGTGTAAECYDPIANP